MANCGCCLEPVDDEREASDLCSEATGMNDGKGWRIKRCPLHGAAEEMRETLTHAVEVMESAKIACVQPGPDCCLVHNARALLAKVPAPQCSAFEKATGQRCLNPAASGTLCAMHASPSDPTPRYRHDCTWCVFLGTEEIEGRPVDWYHCPGKSGGPGSALGGTMVGRKSNRGADYWSCPVDVLRTADLISPMLRAAVARIPKALLT